MRANTRARMSPFMLKLTDVHRGKSVAFIEELLTGTVNFVELSTSYQPPNKPFEGEEAGVRAMDILLNQNHHKFCCSHFID